MSALCFLYDFFLSLLQKEILRTEQHPNSTIAFVSLVVSQKGILPHMTHVQVTEKGVANPLIFLCHNPLPLNFAYFIEKENTQLNQLNLLKGRYVLVRG